jgi:hypothetical protein
MISEALQALQGAFLLVMLVCIVGCAVWGVIEGAYRAGRAVWRVWRARTPS